MKRIILLALSSMLLAGCAQQKQSFWEKPGASGQDFDMDRAFCNAQAFSAPGGNLMTVAIVQNQCLRGKGWYLTDTPSSAPNRVQQVNDEVTAIQNQMVDVTNKPEYASILEKTPAKNADINVTFMSDKTKMTASQKVVFMAYVAELDQLSSKITAVFRSANDPKASRIADLREALDLQSFKNRLNLIDQKITWGEYNINRKEISISFASQFQQINSRR